MSGGRCACGGLLLAGLFSAIVSISDAAEGTEREPEAARSAEDQARAAFDLMQLQRLDEAEQMFRQALTENPGMQQAQFGLGTLYFEMGRYAESIDTLEQLREEAPEFYPVLNNLAWIYATVPDLQFRDGTRSIQLAQEAIFRQPRRFQVWNTLAEAYYILGDYPRSERAARQTLRYAREQNANSAQLTRYRQQVERARIAAHVETLFAEALQQVEKVSPLSGAP